MLTRRTFGASLVLGGVSAMTNTAAADENEYFKGPSAFVLFDRPPPWTGRELRRRHAALFPDHAQGWTFPDAEDDATAALIMIGPTMIASVNIEAPVPGHDFKEEIWLSPWWPDAKRAVEAHRANTLMMMFANNDWPTLSAQDRLAKVIEFGRVLAAFADLPQASAVNWIESGSMYPAKQAVEWLRQGPPPHFWVRTWRFDEALPNGSPGVGAFTKGLRTFVGRELHFHPVAPERGQEIAEYCERVANYLISEGPVIADGDTMEFEPGQKIRVTYGRASSGVPLLEVRL